MKNVILLALLLLMSSCYQQPDNPPEGENIGSTVSWNRGLSCQKVKIDGKGYIVCTAYTYGGRSVAVCKE